jgi:hypothetical protein
VVAPYYLRISASSGLLWYSVVHYHGYNLYGRLIWTSCISCRSMAHLVVLQGYLTLGLWTYCQQLTTGTSFGWV